LAPSSLDLKLKLDVSPSLTHFDQPTLPHFAHNAKELFAPTQSTRRATVMADISQ